VTPTISGTPATTIAVGSAYSFSPTATAATGASLTFSINNPPSWAAFNTATGQLTGTPIAANVGVSSNIIISVSDGVNSAALPAFAITVQGAASPGSVTLSWTAPTLNTDGSALTDLAGYYIGYGTSPTALTQQINVSGSGVTTYTVGGLTAGTTYYFDLIAYDSSNNESQQTGVVSATP
jgi:hypothetical protein